MESEIGKIHEALKSGVFTCAGLVGEKLDALRETQHNTVNFLLEESALEKAHSVDRKIASGDTLGILEGVPFGVKDVFLLQGEKASASSGFLKNYRSPYTATAIQKIIDAGGIPVARENCDSFGHGSSNENSVFGPARNAWDTDRVAGGSSGGSAVNVALGNTAFSIGGDTGGSIRQPAGYNRVYGLKPTYGRISRYGLMAYASSTDCVGPISRSLEDIRILLNIMSGKDPFDQTSIESSPIPGDIFRESYPGKSLKTGFYRNFIENPALDEGIRKDFLSLMDKLRARGIEVRELEFLKPDLLVSTYYILAMAETASNLARLDGMGYGERATAGSLKESYALARSVYLTEETQRRIIGGNQILSHGHAEEIYLKARSLRAEITRGFERDFSRVDLILSPVSTVPPPRIGSVTDPLEMYLSDAFTVGFSLGGLPTLTSPAGTETGVQVSAPKTREDEILKFAKFLEEVA